MQTEQFESGAYEEFDSFDEAPSVTDGELRRVAELARVQLMQEKEVEDLEEKLNRAKQNLRKTCETDLPELLAEIGLSSIALTTGQTITIDESMYASIAKKNKAKAAAWLEEHGQGSLVKNEVSLVLEKGEQEKLERLAELLDHSEFNDYGVTYNMNTGSVKAVIKELKAQGVDTPDELFGIHFVRRSIIK
jgi:hypothetical protein